MMGFFNCVRRVGVMPTSMRRNYASPASVILTSHACLEDEQLLLCGIIAHAKSSVVHHRGLSAEGECKPADILIECSIFVYRLNSFSISEEYASVHLRNYASHRISESYAERILFFFIIFLQPVPSHPYPAILVGSVSSVCVLW